MALITYDDKVALNENASIPDINKVSASDMNQIKTGVNTNESNIGALETSFTDSVTYSTTETVIGTWIDGKPIYRKVITETCSGGTTISINHNISNLNEVISLEYFTFNNTNKNTDIPHNGSNTLSINRITTTTINGSISTGYDSGWQLKIILEYTKTTD
jgi:hypothetical protein